MDADENQFLLRLEVSGAKKNVKQMAYSNGCKYPIKLEVDIINHMYERIQRREYRPQ